MVIDIPMRTALMGLLLRMQRCGLSLSFTALALSLAVGLRAQDQGQPPVTAGRGASGAAPTPQFAPPSNLKILPDTVPQAELIATMRGFTQALGVQCWYCHADVRLPISPNAPALGAPVKRGGPLDYQSDEKPVKSVARVMMTMMAQANERIDKVLGKPAGEQPRIQCMTCHRGRTDPRELSDLLARTMNEKGQGYAISRYRDLRSTYEGTAAYDFREFVLIDLARGSLAANKVDDALAWLQLNLEYFHSQPAAWSYWPTRTLASTT